MPSFSDKLKLTSARRAFIIYSIINDKRKARSLPGVINHYAKAKIMHNVNVYCAFSEGKLRNPTRKLRSKNMIFVGNIISPWKYFAHMCVKYFHGEMALQRNVLFLGLPVYDSVD